MSKVTKKLRILIADDHELVRCGIRTSLRVQPSWSVVGEAADGSEAVVKATKLKPDLVILDISMPKLDGLEATREIREAAPNTQVLVLTMHESDQMVSRAFEAGACGYVMKSDLATFLVKAVKAVSKGMRFLTPNVSDMALDLLLKTGNQPEQTESWQRCPPTPRQVEIIRLLAEGKINKEIAWDLALSVRTVEMHRARIMIKLGVHSFAELIRYAIRYRIVAEQRTGEVSSSAIPGPS